MQHLTLIALALLAACSQAEEKVANSEKGAAPTEAESVQPDEGPGKSFGAVFTSAKVAKVKADIHAIDTAITNYRLRNVRFPDGMEVLIEPDENGHQFLSGAQLPKDPWGNEYQYELPVGEGKHLILSYGADGQPGGQGKAADISNWTIQGE